MDLEKEESIDLGKLWQVTKAHKKVVGGIIVGCTAIATITAFVLPKQYESTTLVQTRSASKEMGGQAAAMLAAATDTSTASPTNNYMELMKTRTVLDPIIDELYEGKDPDKKPDAAGFAKSNLDIKNTKGTNLITVTAKGKTPEEAQQISQEVVDNFLKMQTETTASRPRACSSSSSTAASKRPRKTPTTPPRNSPTSRASTSSTAPTTSSSRPSRRSPPTTSPSPTSRASRKPPRPSTTSPPISSASRSPAPKPTASTTTGLSRASAARSSPRKSSSSACARSTPTTTRPSSPHSSSSTSSRATSPVKSAPSSTPAPPASTPPR